MKNMQIRWKKGEEAVFLLRALFERYGYRQFKMNKFEEYDLYVRNKDFLISDGIITFTDTNGKLLALKPDVTLSIIKNTRMEEGCVEKVYYDENVYRVSEGTHSFKEIMQVGIECIGDMDQYHLYEVLSLAAKSLYSLSENAVLDLSHFGMVSDLIDSFGLGQNEKKQILQTIGEKNVHELSRICEKSGLSSQDTALLCGLVTTYGTPEEVFPKLHALLDGRVSAEKLGQLETLSRKLSEDGFSQMVRIDFSVVNHTDYYNGIIFKGFVKGIPTSVLSGGQYDRLMEKMGHKNGAIGFAVYLDQLEEISEDRKDFDFDTLLTYEASLPFDLVEKAANEMRLAGKTVLAQKKRSSKITCREHYHLTESGVTLLERNA